MGVEALRRARRVRKLESSGSRGIPVVVGKQAAKATTISFITSIN
jgi:hypothetical protein